MAFSNKQAQFCQAVLQLDELEMLAFLGNRENTEQVLDSEE